MTVMCNLGLTATATASGVCPPAAKRPPLHQGAGDSIRASGPGFRHHQWHYFKLSPLTAQPGSGRRRVPGPGQATSRKANTGLHGPPD